MPERTIHERFVKRVTDRNNESSIIHEMSDIIDRTVVKRRETPENRVVLIQPARYPYRVNHPSTHTPHQSSNESKHDRYKPATARDSALLEQLEQILSRVQQLETLKTETAKPKDNIPKQGRADIPSINITIPFLDVVLESMKKMETQLGKLQEDIHTLQVERKNNQEQILNETTRHFENLNHTVSSQLSELLLENKAVNLKIEEVLAKLREERDPSKSEALNLIEEIDNLSMHSKQSSQSSILSSPVRIENGPRPSQAFIHFSPERTNSGPSVTSSQKLTNDEEEEIEL